MFSLSHSLGLTLYAEKEKCLLHPRDDDNQPSRDRLYSFFLDRRWRSTEDESLFAAVAYGLDLEKKLGNPSCGYV